MVSNGWVIDLGEKGEVHFFFFLNPTVESAKTNRYKAAYHYSSSVFDIYIYIYICGLRYGGDVSVKEINA
jgi:hypothetical protein